MKRELPRYRRIERRLNLIALVANGCGAALITFYFSNIHREGVQGIAGGSLAGVAIEGVILVSLFLLGHFLPSRLIAPMLAWYKQNVDNPKPELAPLRVRQLALDLPAILAGTSLAVWVLAGLSSGVVEAFDFSTYAFDWTLFVQILLGSEIVSFVSAVIVYLAAERVWRVELPRFFAGEDLTKTPAFRLRVRARLLTMFAMAAMPLLDLAILSYSQAVQIANAPQPADLLPRLLLLEVLLVGSGALVAVILAVNLASSLIRPLETLSQRMRAVEEGDLDVRMRVTSNDEIGVVSECFNSMVESLQRREVELRTLYQISRDITASLELGQTLETVLAQVRQMIAYDVAEVYLYEERDQVLRVGAWMERDQIHVEAEGRACRPGEGAAGLVAQQRQSLLVADVEAQEGLQPDAVQNAAGITASSYLGVPLLAGQGLVGVVSLAGAQPGAFDTRAQQLLETIAPQAAVAIGNAMQVLERERQLKEQIELLRIQIDETRRERQVAEITETDYFQELQKQARRMRKEEEDE